MSLLGHPKWVEDRLGSSALHFRGATIHSYTPLPPSCQTLVSPQHLPGRLYNTRCCNYCVQIITVLIDFAIWKVPKWNNQTSYLSRPCNAAPTFPPAHHLHPSYQCYGQGSLNVLIQIDKCLILAFSFHHHFHHNYDQGEAAVAMGMAEMSDGELCRHATFAIAEMSKCLKILLKCLKILLICLKILLQCFKILLKCLRTLLKCLKLWLKCLQTLL